MGTFCSGIGAPEVAARGMFDPIWFSEIEPFPCAVLAHHWPTVPNLGDMTASDLVERIAGIGLPDVVVAGLPCQPFSVAGLRNGEADPRNLTARFVEIADAIDDLRRDAGQPPVWWLVENVPGLLSDKGNAFGALLGGMVGSNSAIVPSGRWECAGVAAGPRRSAAWRVLDAQFFGVAQRRRRVFALFVADSGNLRCADALLPIINSMSWNPPPRRETGQGATRDVEFGPSGGGFTDVNPTLDTRAKDGPVRNQLADAVLESYRMTAFGEYVADGTASTTKARDFKGATDLIAHTFKAEGFDASEDGTGRGTPIVPVAFDCKGHAAVAEPFVMMERGRADGRSLEYRQDGTANAILTPNGGRGGFGIGEIAAPWAVRRLMPVECARLQGFPDDRTAITYRGKPAADGPQYKAYGNSMCVNVMAWIMDRMRISMEAAE